MRKQCGAWLLYSLLVVGACNKDPGAQGAKAAEKPGREGIDVQKDFEYLYDVLEVSYLTVAKGVRVRKLDKSLDAVERYAKQESERIAGVGKRLDAIILSDAEALHLRRFGEKVTVLLGKYNTHLDLNFNPAQRKRFVTTVIDGIAKRFMDQVKGPRSTAELLEKKRAPTSLKEKLGDFTWDWSDPDKLFLASRDGDLAKVKALLGKGVNVNHRFLHRQEDFQPLETPLQVAAKTPNLEVVKALVEAGAELEAQQTVTSATALWNAVQHKQRPVIEYLLGKGACPQVDAEMGTTPLMLAIEQDDRGLLDLLIRYGAWPDSSLVSARSVGGKMGLDAIRMAQTLKRPYVGMLKAAEARCRKALKAEPTCALVKVEEKPAKNRPLDF